MVEHYHSGYLFGASPGNLSIGRRAGGNNGTANGFGSADTEKVKVSANDTTAGFLNGKLVAGTNISLTEGSDGGNETLTAALSGTIPTARLGSGTASSSTFLRGDNTFAEAGGGKIGQVVSTAKVDTFSTSSSSFTNKKYFVRERIIEF